MGDICSFCRDEEPQISSADSLLVPDDLNSVTKVSYPALKGLLPKSISAFEMEALRTRNKGEATYALLSKKGLEVRYYNPRDGSTYPWFVRVVSRSPRDRPTEEYGDRTPWSPGWRDSFTPSGIKEQPSQTLECPEIPGIDDWQDRLQKRILQWDRTIKKVPHYDHIFELHELRKTKKSYRDCGRRWKLYPNTKIIRVDDPQLMKHRRAYMTASAIARNDPRLGIIVFIKWGKGADERALVPLLFYNSSARDAFVEMKQRLEDLRTFRGMQAEEDATLSSGAPTPSTPSSIETTDKQIVDRQWNRSRKKNLLRKSEKEKEQWTQTNMETSSEPLASRRSSALDRQSQEGSKKESPERAEILWNVSGKMSKLMKKARSVNLIRSFRK